MSWKAALLGALDHAIEHLQILVFHEGMDALAATAGSEAALRESVLRYEQGLTQLFGFMRASGVLQDGVEWSTLKSDMRRFALESGTEITLRTALESGMYAAEQTPLGDHAMFGAWAGPLTAMLLARAEAVAPMPAAGEDERLYWAYETLADLEDHAAFHGALVKALNAGACDGVDAVAVVAFQERLLQMARFDLVLNASLLWLAQHGASET